MCFTPIEQSIIADTFQVSTQLSSEVSDLGCIASLSLRLPQCYIAGGHYCMLSACMYRRSAILISSRCVQECSHWPLGAVVCAAQEQVPGFVAHEGLSYAPLPDEEKTLVVL